MEEDNSQIKPLLGVALNLDADFLKASFPLFVNSEIEVIEWSFDTILYPIDEPSWLNPLLLEYSNANHLLGHGVFFSLMNAKWSKKQDIWLKKMEEEVKKYRYNHITEHFGFMSSYDFHRGFPLPVTLNQSTLAIGIDRLKRIQKAVNIPVGIENLAFSFSKEDVEKQGDFLEKLIDPINGFIILDLHNIYCQSQNFEIDMIDLIGSYPLHKVKEIHVSGGSWENSIYRKKPIRRDTHDGKVPEAIFQILPYVLDSCKYLEFVILERMGNTFDQPRDLIDYKNDYLRLKTIISKSSGIFTKNKWGKQVIVSDCPINDTSLFEEQKLLCELLSTSQNYIELKKGFTHWNAESWDIEMIETALSLHKKWNKSS